MNISDVNLKRLERSLKAVANKRRLAILQYLKRHDEVTVGDIASAIKLSFKSTSRHLSLLLLADILEKEQRGIEVFYRLTKDLKKEIGAVLNSL
ncbi:MAG: metalloregulator ArsR/SmtB family transcription factor [bacterium]|nr:metalloregulator ArsR/SmtB family transcription factor [bacterium]